MQYSVEELIETGDRIVIRATVRGAGVVAQVHGDAAAGKPYVMATIHVYRTEGERLAEHWGVRDEAGVMRQLGMLSGC
ncbi:ester cyclase [Aestuariimicrobium ganziense]|uniref:ester cyclase n=1 Tax=Aestuariimicrobium ganziense TaxID=2773677 RepID=UPI00194082AE|nr:ester cyclase [Aestuariimicrobium ganziense]